MGGSVTFNAHCMQGFEGLLSGRTLADRYRIEEVIGRGGFAAVYRAVDERLGRTVAVKVITMTASDPQVRETIRKRFHREALAIARLHHPNVVTVHDFGTDPTLGLDYLVMEMLQGEDLSNRLDRPEPFSLEGALRILRDATVGVSEGHRAGVIHRDLKPGNIFLVNPDDPHRYRVCVLDFGIARFTLAEDLTPLTHSGGLMLSPAYASPEQLAGESGITAASDVFSLGVIGYELLTRQRPFGKNRLQRPAALAEDLVPMRERNAEIPRSIAAVIERALSLDPGARFPEAGAFANALAMASIVAGTSLPPLVVSTPGGAREQADPEPLPPSPGEPRPAPAPAAGPAARPAAPRSRRRAAPLAMAALVVLAAVAAWWFAAGREPDRVARSPERPSGREPPRVFQDTARTVFSAGSPPQQRAGTSGSSDAPPDGSFAAGGAASAAEVPATRPSGAPAPAPRTQRSGGATAAATPAAAPAVAPRGAAGRAAALRLNREGELAFERGDLATAAARFRAATQEDPASAHFRNNLGWALFQMGQVDAAGRELEAVVRLDPQREIAYANIGEVRWARGDTAGAIAAYQRFLALNDDPRRERIAREKLQRMGASPASR